MDRAHPAFVRTQVALGGPHPASDRTLSARRHRRPRHKVAEANVERNFQLLMFVFSATIVAPNSKYKNNIGNSILYRRFPPATHCSN